MTNNFKYLSNGEYPYGYLASSTNKKIRVLKGLAVVGDASNWLGRKQPFSPIAPPMIGGLNG